MHRRPLFTAALLALLTLLAPVHALAASQSPAATATDIQQAKAIFARLQAGQGHTVHAKQGGEPYVLAPGQIITFEHEGYCMDSDRPVPGRNEPLAFVPITGLIAPSLIPLYRQIMRLDGAGNTGGADIQNLVWGFRAPKAKPGPKERALLDRAQSGGANLYATAARGQYINDNAAGRGSGSSRGSSRGNTPGGDVLGQLFGQLLTDFTRPSQDLMRALRGMQADSPLPGEDRQYSLLSAGVAGRATGLGGLKVRASVANGTDKPYVFDPTLWALESPRRVQRVSLPLFRQASLNTQPSAEQRGKGQDKDEPLIPDTKGPQEKPNEQGSSRDKAPNSDKGEAYEFQMKP